MNCQNKYSINSHTEKKNDVFDLTRVFLRISKLSAFKYLWIEIPGTEAVLKRLKAVILPSLPFGNLDKMQLKRNS